MITPEDIENWFTYHPPKSSDLHKFQTIRDVGRSVAQAILAYTPAGAEQDLAIQKVREAVMWANAGIACEK